MSEKFNSLPHLSVSEAAALAKNKSAMPTVGGQHEQLGELLHALDQISGRTSSEAMTRLKAQASSDYHSAASAMYDLEAEKLAKSIAPYVAVNSASSAYEQAIGAQRVLEAELKRSTGFLQESS